MNTLHTNCVGPFDHGIESRWLAAPVLWAAQQPGRWALSTGDQSRVPAWLGKIDAGKRREARWCNWIEKPLSVPGREGDRLEPLFLLGTVGGRLLIDPAMSLIHHFGD